MGAMSANQTGCVTTNNIFAPNILPRANARLLFRSPAHVAGHAGLRARWAISPSRFPDSLTAPLTLQLQVRHLTKDFLRVLNGATAKNLSRSFPHDEKFCASMPPDLFQKFSFVQGNRSPIKRGVLH
jgi:hypothetical protein